MKQLFDSFKRFAFRLELLQKYDIEAEKSGLAEYVRTGTFDTSTFSEWHKTIKDAKKRGACIERCHIIARPLTPYLQFELEAYKSNQRVGENVYLLEQKDFKALKSDIDHDFWLFDDDIVVKMKYSSEGTYLGYDVMEKNIKRYIILREQILAKALSLKDFDFN